MTIYKLKFKGLSEEILFTWLAKPKGISYVTSVTVLAPSVLRSAKLMTIVIKVIN